MHKLLSTDLKLLYHNIQLTREDGLSGIGWFHCQYTARGQVVLHHKVKTILVQGLHGNDRDSTVVGYQVKGRETDKQKPNHPRKEGRERERERGRKREREREREGVSKSVIHTP